MSLGLRVNHSGVFADFARLGWFELYQGTNLAFVRECYNRKAVGEGYTPRTPITDRVSFP